MAKVNQRLWRVPGLRVKRKAWGFTVQEDGKQKRCYKAEWTREDAEKALAALLLQIEQRPKTKLVGMTFGQAVDRYLAAKARKLSLETDCLRLARLKAAFGAETPLAEITAGRIAEYKIQRLRSQVRRAGEQHDIAPATVNREMATLRHLLRLAHDEWETRRRCRGSGWRWNRRAVCAG